MTQVKEMTNPELNRKLAELMGWKVVQSHDEKEGGGAPYYQLVGPGFTGMFYRKPENVWKSVPEFSTDPAASLEVQAAACKVSREKYVLNLVIAKWNVKAEDATAWNNMTLHEIGQLLTATPRERAEAAYQTLQEAKGDD